MITAEVLQRQLVHLAESGGPVISSILEPRTSGGLNDVLLGYYSWLMSEPPSESPDPVPHVDRLCVALDIVLRNQGVPFDSRRAFVTELREICKREPELLQGDVVPAPREG